VRTFQVKMLHLSQALGQVQVRPFADPTSAPGQGLTGGVSRQDFRPPKRPDLCILATVSVSVGASVWCAAPLRWVGSAVTPQSAQVWRMNTC